jgi:small subunit ribosomal protein S21
MLIVSVKNENIEWALKEYKKKVQSTKQIEQLREKKNFTKPSVRKRLQKEETIRKTNYFSSFL